MEISKLMLILGWLVIKETTSIPSFFKASNICSLSLYNETGAKSTLTTKGTLIFCFDLTGDGVLPTLPLLCWFSLLFRYPGDVSSCHISHSCALLKTGPKVSKDFKNWLSIASGFSIGLPWCCTTGALGAG